MLGDEVNGLIDQGLNGATTNDVKEVMDTVVIENSRESYNNSNIKFLQYLFEANSPLLTNVAMESYIRAESEDKEGSNKNIRKAMRDSLRRCVSYDTCPIKLKELSFDVFRSI